jgi:hypothetical protein
VEANLHAELSNDDDELVNPMYQKEVKVTQTSPTVNLLAALTRNSTSRNRSQQGRGRQKIILNPQMKWNLGL